MLETILIIGLVILAIIVVAGIIRVIIEPADSFGDLILHVLMLDLMFDVLGSIAEGIGDIADGFGDIDIDL